MLGDKLKSPEAASRFFAACGYTKDQIIEYLIERLDQSQEAAEHWAEKALDYIRRLDDEEGRTEQRYERARAAEMDLSRTTWG